MDPEEILELVKDGVIEPDQIQDFEALDSEIQQLVGGRGTGTFILMNL